MRGAAAKFNGSSTTNQRVADSPSPSSHPASYLGFLATLFNMSRVSGSGRSFPLVGTWLRREAVELACGCRVGNAADTNCRPLPRAWAKRNRKSNRKGVPDTGIANDGALAGTTGLNSISPGSSSGSARAFLTQGAGTSGDAGREANMLWIEHREARSAGGEGGHRGRVA